MKKLLRHYRVLLIVSGALIFRLFLLSLPPFKTDMDSFIAWGEQMLNVGPGRFYRSGIWSDYAPGYMYFMWAVAAIKHTLFPSASREMYEFLHKSVPVIFDLLTGLLLYKIMITVIRKSQEIDKIRTYYLPEIVAGVYLFSPFVVLTSAVWGQVDSVYVFFLLLSFYYVLLKKLPLSCAVFVIATVIKPQSVILAPFFALLFIKERDIKLFITSAIYSVVTFFVLTMPFFGLGAIGAMWKLLDSSVNVYPYTSLNTFNYWGIGGFWKSDTLIYAFGVTARSFGYILWGLTLLFGLVMGYLFLYQRKMMIALNGALLSSFFILSAVMFLTRMHERYLFPLFVYFILASGIYTYMVFSEGRTKERWLVGVIWILYALFALLHTINLYYVYIFYTYFLQEPRVSVPMTNTLYYFIERLLTVWSYIQVLVYLIFAGLLPVYLKELSSRNNSK